MSHSRSGSSHELGRRAERLAEAHLQQQGLTTVKRNHRFARGEIDIIMLDGTILVFVEVRFRKTGIYGDAKESVFNIKQRRLIMAAQHFLQTQSRYANHVCRFDVVVVNANGELDDRAQIEWIRDAFQA